MTLICLTLQCSVPALPFPQPQFFATSLPICCCSSHWEDETFPIPLRLLPSCHARTTAHTPPHTHTLRFGLSPRQTHAGLLGTSSLSILVVGTGRDPSQTGTGTQAVLPHLPFHSPAPIPHMTIPIALPAMLVVG